MLEDLKKEKIQQMESENSEMQSNIHKLEQVESGMLKSLQQSINEHQKILKLSKSGELEAVTERSGDKRSTNFEFGRPWQP